LGVYLKRRRGSTSIYHVQEEGKNERLLLVGEREQKNPINKKIKKKKVF
jgi:hypothetical protein